jgi:Na+/H+ antiporter NhaD/arsenite permease-like protein
LIDWRTIAALAGLLTLTKGIELSGYLSSFGQALIARMRTQRALALMLVGAAALLAMVLTNDIALFVIVPLTLGLAELATVPVARLIIFEALAVNAGSVLTPIGNPQNLFLWQLNNVAFIAFMGRMAPLCLLLIASLLLLTAVSFQARPIRLHTEPANKPLDAKLLTVSIGLYIPFIVLADVGPVEIGALVLLAIYAIAFRDVLKRVDWALIVVFMLMFIDLRLIADLPWVRALLRSLAWTHAPTVFLTAALASQAISNVPSAILLAQYAHHWPALAWGVSVGGFGLAIGSLANIIALRLAGRHGRWLGFHLVSIPFFMAMAAIVYFWLKLVSF